MASTSERGPAVALLFDDQDSGLRLREALCERGAHIVLESRVDTFASQQLAEHAADVVVLNLDPDDMDALVRVVDALDSSRQRLVLNDAEATRTLAGWDAARWARHLAAKILGTDVDPPRPSDAVPVTVSIAGSGVAADAVPSHPAPPVAADTHPVEPAMNAALAREIETFLVDAEAMTAERVASDSAGPDDAVAFDPIAPVGHGSDALRAAIRAPAADAYAPHDPIVLPTHADDDLDALLASFAATESAPAPPAMESAPAVAPTVPVKPAPDAGSRTVDIGTFDLDAVLAELPDALAVTTPPRDDDDADRRATSESIPAERVPQAEALAHPQPEATMEELNSLELDALLAEILPSAPPAAPNAQTVPPIPVKPDDIGVDPLLSSLAVAQLESLPTELLDFDPETWEPPADPSSAATADAGAVAPSATPSAPDAPVRVGDAAPDLELMLDEMFDQPVAQAPLAAAPATPVAVPDWGLLDGDAAMTSQSAAAGQLSASAAATMDLDGLELLPIGAESALPAHAVATRAPQGDVRKVVVIGASIGGPDAVREFLSVLAPGLPLLVVVAQHLDESFFVGYAAQFARALPHTVHVAAEGLISGAGQVLLVPPRARIAIDPGGGVHLLPGGDERYTPSIDDTFTRIAEVFGPRALALVFSGMASDGVHGMARIVEYGGQIWTQAPSSCVVSAMVDAACAAGYSVCSGTPAELAGRLNAEFSRG